MKISYLRNKKWNGTFFIYKTEHEDELILIFGLEQETEPGWLQNQSENKILIETKSNDIITSL